MTDLLDERSIGGGYLEDALVGIEPRLLEHPAGRRELTKLDPLAFALTYLGHHLHSEATHQAVTLSEFHVDLIEHALEWLKPLGAMRQYRDAYIAPREVGKSTWLFLILPLWAAAHGHTRFIAAFADSTPQAEEHLQTFRHELDTNDLLKTDYPALCTPARQTKVARTLAQRRGQIKQANGFTFMANGLDSAVLGMKVGELRPQVIIIDDPEPGEGSYSLYQAGKRLTTLLDVILPLNAFARVILSGTVTMPGSIVHQLVKTVTRPGEEQAAWVGEENFRVHYYPAIIDNGDGTERSIWPEKWPLEVLAEVRSSRSFRKNMMNDPIAMDEGTWWDPDTIHIAVRDSYGPTLLSIDPAVTDRTSSDFTGLAVISRTIKDIETPAKAFVRHAERIKVSPAKLRERVLALIEVYDDIGLVLVESNQGGDAWRAILHGLPVKLKTIHQSDPKLVRAQRALNLYERKRVFHTKDMPQANDELLAFPNAPNDDIVDAISTGVNYVLKRSKRTRASADMVPLED